MDRVQSIIDGLAEVLYRFPFKVPAYYALIARSLTVLEGIAMRSDPSYKVCISPSLLFLCESFWKMYNIVLARRCADLTSMQLLLLKT